GWKYWQTTNGVVSTTVTDSTPKVFKPNPNRKLLVDVTYMEENVGNEKLLYVDSRAAKRYRGEEEPIDPIAGHIPSAISAPFAENLGTDGLFLDKESLTKRFEKLLNTQPVNQTIFYCGSGVTACHNLLAMHHIGKTEALLFPGSWSEWIVGGKRAIGNL
ncbi:MAG: sulfurtransferase, partial [Saprospiraceae bacterium]